MIGDAGCWCWDLRSYLDRVGFWFWLIDLSFGMAKSELPMVVLV